MHFEDFLPHANTACYSTNVIVQSLQDHKLGCRYAEPCEEAVKFFTPFLSNFKDDEHALDPKSLATYDLLVYVHHEDAPDAVLGLCVGTVVRSELEPRRDGLFVRTFISVRGSHSNLGILCPRIIMRAAEGFVDAEFPTKSPRVDALRGKPFVLVAPCPFIGVPFAGFERCAEDDWDVLSTGDDRALCERAYGRPVRMRSPPQPPYHPDTDESGSYTPCRSPRASPSCTPPL